MEYLVMVKIQIIRRKNGLCLIQWIDSNDMFHRGWIPDIEISFGSGNEGKVQDPNMSVPFGIPWRELISLNATPQDLENELYRRGIWTIEDLRQNPQGALSSIQSVYGMDLSALLNEARLYEKERK